MEIGDKFFYGLTWTDLQEMEVTELDGVKNGYTIVISMELIRTYNGNGTYELKLYKNAEPKNFVINGWSINHKNTIGFNWGGRDWRLTLKDVFGNEVEFYEKDKQENKQFIAQYFTNIYKTITYSTPKVSSMIYHIKKNSWRYTGNKNVSKEFYMQIMDEVSKVENMKKLSNDEISSLTTPNLMEFQLLYMNMIDGVSHLIVEDK